MVGFPPTGAADDGGGGAGFDGGFAGTESTGLDGPGGGGASDFVGFGGFESTGAGWLATGASDDFFGVGAGGSELGAGFDDGAGAGAGAELLFPAGWTPTATLLVPALAEACTPPALSLTFTFFASTSPERSRAIKRVYFDRIQTIFNTENGLTAAINEWTW